jgi:preprotein translocase subunit SecA
MFSGLLKKIMGSSNERDLKLIQPLVDQINGLEDGMRALSDEELKGQTLKFRDRIEQGEGLDTLQPEAFATVRETGRRVLNMRHYDVQLIGGEVLHSGRIAEMKTGEGKTLVATLPMYLNALGGKGVHLVTVNDYLARRDAEWMSQIYHFLGMTVGIVYSDMPGQERMDAYRSDITYGQNNEFGFDYLRDNMKSSFDRFVQRPLNYAIVDEVDSILIDEARTPLIISGRAEKSSDLYYKVNDLIRGLKREQDFIVDEKAHSCSLTEVGVDKIERRMELDNLYGPDSAELLHHINQALRANNLYKRDGNYLVDEGKVVIIDEFTGRKMPGRRWSDGLHQAVEAKEGLQIQDENQTMATVTFQNYFRMYEKLSGMTGTADTEAEEFANIYDLDVMVIPTNRPIVRKDHDDIVYVKERAKLTSVIDDIVESYEREQPVLVGTTSVDKSEFLSRILNKKNIKHHTLNAKFHESEANIVSQAGAPGAVTIATNMAGRGTDIVLGGNPEVLARNEVGPDASEEDYASALERFQAGAEDRRARVLAAGGLHIIGTERHESRRIDNQLRGRAGRQGDAGSSRFFLSLEDDLLRIFGADRIQRMLERFQVPEDEPIEHKWVTKSIANAQRKVEARNFDIRKNLLDYDDVMNRQREAIYGRRREVMGSDDTHDFIFEAVERVSEGIVHAYCSTDGDEGGTWEPKDLEDALKRTFHHRLDLSDQHPNDLEGLVDFVAESLKQVYVGKEDAIVSNMVTSSRYEAEEGWALKTAEAEKAGEDIGSLVIHEEKLREAKLGEWRNYERHRYLEIIDGLWKDHIQALSRLKEGIHLHAYAQKDPKLIYKEEAFDLFSQLFGLIWQKHAETVFQQEVHSESEIKRQIDDRKRSLDKKLKEMQTTHQSLTSTAPESEGGSQKVQTFRREAPKVGRNDPCPCGSGKKFKKCHGRDGAEGSVNA